MSNESKIIEDDSSPVLTEYGQFTLLLDAKPSVLKEAIKDASVKQKRRIISTMEDQLNYMPIQGNEELFKRHLYVWMFTIRQLDDGPANDKEVDNFQLDFTRWERDQFH